eukprot:jgi/Ulvmu1/11205/UM072_0042.1
MSDQCSIGMARVSGLLLFNHVACISYWYTTCGCLCKIGNCALEARQLLSRVSRRHICVANHLCAYGNYVYQYTRRYCCQKRLWAVHNCISTENCDTFPAEHGARVR